MNALPQITSIGAPSEIHCQQCGGLFYRSPRESDKQWTARRFCSRTCFQAEQASRTIPAGSTRTCEECGAAFTKRRRENAAQWLNRHRFCSSACARAAQGKKRIAALPDIKTAFESRVGKTSGCWLWQGPKSGNGYGVFIYANKRYRAHVFALKLDGRPVPKGKQGLHHCDTPLCVRPSHLYIGTPKMNVDDIWSRDRAPQGVRHPRAKLAPEAVLEMRRIRKQGISYEQIARTFSVAATTAAKAILGRTWKSVPSNADDLGRLKQIHVRVALKGNPSGFRGVYRHGARYKAVISALGVSRHLGVFDRPEEASAAYEAAARELYGEFYSEPQP